MKTVVFETTKGEMEFELYEQDAPVSVAFFCQLVESGYYDDNVFFQYLPNEFIKSGCPMGNGTGFPGFLIKSEVEGKLQEHDRGVISLVCGQLNTVGSQFVICLSRESTQEFDGQHTCIGKLRNRGWEVLSRLRRYDSIITASLSEIDDSFDEED